MELKLTHKYPAIITSVSTLSVCNRKYFPNNGGMLAPGVRTRAIKNVFNNHHGNEEVKTLQQKKHIGRSVEVMLVKNKHLCVPS